MHTTTYTRPDRAEAREAHVIPRIWPSRRDDAAGGKQRLANAAERAERTRLLLAQSVCA